MGSVGAAGAVAFVALAMALWLIADRSDDPERGDRVGWHRPLGWALLVSAVALVIVGVPTAAVGSPASPPASDSASSPTHPPNLMRPLTARD